MIGGVNGLMSQGAADATFAANNRASTQKAVLIHETKSFDLVFFSSIKRYQHRRKKTGRQQPAVINLLKKNLT